MSTSATQVAMYPSHSVRPVSNVPLTVSARKALVRGRHNLEFHTFGERETFLSPYSCTYVDHPAYIDSGDCLSITTNVAALVQVRCLHMEFWRTRAVIPSRGLAWEGIPEIAECLQMMPGQAGLQSPLVSHPVHVYCRKATGGFQNAGILPRRV